MGEEERRRTRKRECELLALRVVKGVRRGREGGGEGARCLANASETGSMASALHHPASRPASL